MSKEFEEKVFEHFNKIDEKFDKVDKRFEDMDKRFENIKKRDSFGNGRLCKRVFCIGRRCNSRIAFKAYLQARYKKSTRRGNSRYTAAEHSVGHILLQGRIC